MLEMHTLTYFQSQVLDVMKTEDLYLFEPRATRKPPLDWCSKVQSLTDPGLANPRVWLMVDAMHVMLPNRGMGGATKQCSTQL